MLDKIHITFVPGARFLIASNTSSDLALPAMLYSDFRGLECPYIDRDSNFVFVLCLGRRLYS
jgi:hypothetical protein